jgi:hypothetical protein
MQVAPVHRQRGMRQPLLPVGLDLQEACLLQGLREGLDPGREQAGTFGDGLPPEGC